MIRTLQTTRNYPNKNDGGDDYDDETETSYDETDDDIAGEDNEATDHMTGDDKSRRVELENAPMQVEVKHLEKHWTTRCTSYITEPQEDEKIPDQKIQWHKKFVLCVIRTFDTNNRYVIETALQINSKPLKDLLANVIGSYPGQPFHTAEVSVAYPAHCLYHYRPELLAALASENLTKDQQAHLTVLLDFLNDHFAEELKEVQNLHTKELITYKNLWTIFKPGLLVFAILRGQQRVVKLINYSYSCGDCPHLMLSVQGVNYDGKNFGFHGQAISLSPFTGSAPIASLNAFPLSFHPEEDQIRQKLVSRGRRWEALAGQNFREYNGTAVDDRGNLYNIESRVMVDTKTFHRIIPNAAFKVDAFPKLAGKRKQPEGSENWALITKDTLEETLAPLTDEQCLLGSPTVRGFSFAEKLFLEFYVDKLSEIEWNTKCFEQLVLPESQKDLVQALVSEHTQRATGPQAHFDDIVKGKGRGLILVLHGPPGVGKTLTAECVAEYSRRPLYIVSSGDLGTSSTALEEKLSRCLDLASTWKAVLLIDEADVFLEARSLNDMHRNSLVSIFLRTLEYYKGILFMTTNRVTTFDDAFKSRIHVPLKFEALPASSRLKVWKNFLGRLEESGDVDMDEEDYRRLAEVPMNGRQIKNVVRTAQSLARYKKRRLDHEQLLQVMQIQKDFEDEMNGVDKQE